MGKYTAQSDKKKHEEGLKFETASYPTPDVAHKYEEKEEKLKKRVTKEIKLDVSSKDE